MCKIIKIYTKWAINIAERNNAPITFSGTNPSIFFPGSIESAGVDRPKKYLSGPALVISQEITRVPIVEKMRTIGSDPE